MGNFFSDKNILGEKRLSKAGIGLSKTGGKNTIIFLIAKFFLFRKIM